MSDNKANKRRNMGIFQVCLAQLSIIKAFYLRGYLRCEVLGAIPESTANVQPVVPVTQLSPINRASTALSVLCFNTPCKQATCGASW